MFFYSKGSFNKITFLFPPKNIIKDLSLFICIALCIHCLITNNNAKSNLNINYFQVQSDIKLFFNNNINKKIRIGIYTHNLSNGGLQRITSILVNYLEKFKIFKIYLFTQTNREIGEYEISTNIKRVIIKKVTDVKYLIRKIKKTKINIFIYQFPIYNEIKELNNLKNTKIIFYIHQSFFFWFYARLFNSLKIYQEYEKAKYIISLVPVETDYLFKKWGINAILFENFLTYNYNSTIISNLSDKKILLIGRGKSLLKRFELGITSMEYIKNEMIGAVLNIICKDQGIEYLKFFVNNLNLQESIKFLNYSSDPSIYFKDASLNILTSISESFSLVLSETKLFGIPNILIGLDYVLLASNGTIIIYDDQPETLAKVALKILFKKLYKKKLARKARISMKKFNNEDLIKKWKILLLLSYNNCNNSEIYFKRIIDNRKKVYKIFKRQVELLKRRIPQLKNLTYEDLENLHKTNFSSSIFNNL